MEPHGVLSSWMPNERPSFRNPCYAQRQQLQWAIFSQLQRILQRRIPLLWFIQHGSFYGFQSYMGSDYSPFSSRFGRMMRNMYSAGCGMQMNSMYRNFGNQFYGNQFYGNKYF